MDDERNLLSRGSPCRLQKDSSGISHIYLNSVPLPAKPNEKTKRTWYRPSSGKQFGERGPREQARCYFDSFHGQAKSDSQYLTNVVGN
jgi:hypothetical protein